MRIVSQRSPSPSRVTRSPAATAGVAAVDRALLVLSALSDGSGAMPLNEIAHRTGLYKSTILRLLTSLAHANLVAQQPDGRYVLGPTVVKLHATYMQSFSSRHPTIAALRGLVDTTRESAAFYVQRGEFRLCLHRVPSPHAVRDNIETGDLLPLDRGAAGRVLQAYGHAGDPELGQRIRREQVVLLTGDRDPELAGIAAPVFGALGEVVGAITLIIPSARVQQSWITPVREAAQALSRSLGGQFPAGSRD